MMIREQMFGPRYIYKWSKTLFLCPPMLTDIAGQSSQSGNGMNKKNYEARTSPVPE
jgi:hypothetical protein